VGIFNPFAVKPGMDFPRADNFTARPFSYAFGIGNMVGVTVRDEYKIAWNRLNINILRQRITRNKWVEQDMLILRKNAETRMSVIFYYHKRYGYLFKMRREDTEFDGF
jgi:hypothetical protein